MDAFTVLAMLWAAVNAIPPVLFIIYFFTKGRLLRWSCHVGQLLGLLLCIGELNIGCRLATGSSLILM